MTRNCFMASLDLTDAYYSVSINRDSQKYLRFKVDTQLYITNLLHCQMGWALHPVSLSHSWNQCIPLCEIDVLFLVVTKMTVAYLVIRLFNARQMWTILILSLVTWVLLCRKRKSVTQPTQVLEHLGFVLNPINMTVGLTRKKIDSITRLAQDILRRPTCSIREAAQLIGTLVSSSPGVEYGPLFYKQLEIEKKNDALKKHKGSFEVQMQFSELARSDIHWWAEKSWFYVKTISHGSPHFKLTTDASLKGCGAYRDGIWSLQEADGQQEKLLRINKLIVLKLKLPN